MLPSDPPFLLALMLLHGAPETKPFSAMACEDTPRIELSREPAGVVREICVSPGSMTGFVFDAPFSVDLQDAARLVKVLRGPGGISLVPTPDMTPGKRLQLTARLGEGESQRNITFMLVARPGQATRQVEVYHDSRSRESYEQEVELERAKSQTLREENQRLHARLLSTAGLRGLFLEGALDVRGVVSMRLKSKASEEQPSEGAPVGIVSCESYRSGTSVAVGLRLRNLGTEPWMLEAASLVTQAGEELKELKLGPAEAIAPQEVVRVVVELDATPEDRFGVFTLLLRDARGRILSIPQVSFP